MSEENTEDLNQEEEGKIREVIPVSGMYESWFLDYASYVILERAVPAIEDGFKPVQRRILHSMKEMDDGRYMMVLRGLKRFQTTQILDVTTPYQQAEISFDDFARDIDIHEDQQTPEALRIDKSERGVLTMAMKSYAKTLGVKLDWESLKEIPIDRLVDQAAMISPFDPADKQSLLEAKTHEERRRLLIGLMHLYARPHDGDSGTLQ